MKRKLIVTLVASALELYAASAGAQVSCNLVGTATTANAATPVRVGPMNPTTGFPEYVTDSNGVSVQRCLDVNFCFFDPVVATDPFSIQIGSGVEAFYWGTDGTVFNAAGDRILTMNMAAETAFLQVGPNGEPINGSQFPFLRLRFTMGVPVDGTYTVVHPFGTDQFKVTGATGARDVFATVDKGLTPNTTVTGSVGPFLKWDPRFAAVPVGFLGDGGAAAVPQLIVGSPCGTDYIEVSGVDTAGNPVDFGVNETLLHLDSFNVQGQIFDGRVQTPLVASRNTYSRAAVGGQIDSFATSTANAVVSVQDGPNTPVGSSRIAAAQTLDRTPLALDPANAVDSRSVVLANASTVPVILSVTANDSLTTVTPVGGVPQRAFDPTTLNVPLVDFVDISQADYDPSTGILAITASSGDAQANPALTLREFGTTLTSGAITLITTVAPPGSVTVDSAAGGTSTHQVRVIKSVAPLAPATLSATTVSSTTVTLTWADSSDNESGFRVYSVNTTTGARTLLTTTAANVTSFVVTGLAALSTNTFQVDSFNVSGAASSPLVTATTVALPAAPTTVVAALSSTPARSISVSFTDNATDETRYTISRSTTAAGTYTNVGTLTGAAIAGTGARTFVDTSAALANNTTYFYRVVAERVVGAVVESSTVAQSAVGLTTPVAPTSILAPTFTGLASNSITVNWVDRATTETGFDIYRSTVATGGFVKIGTVGANVATFTDNVANNPTLPLVPGTTYFYRINSVNWAASVNGNVSGGVVPPLAVVTLNAVTNLAATPAGANPPALSWGDATTGETGYRVQRRTVTLANNGTATNGTFATVSTLAANATGFTDAAQTANAIVEYSVAPLNGPTVGPVTTVRAVPGGIPGVVAAPTFTRVANTVTVSWAQAGTNAANRAGVGGYNVQRCTVTVADNCAVASTGWATVATATGRTTLTATNTVAASAPARTYVYRIVSTTGPNAASTVTGTPSPNSANLVR